MNRQKKAQGLKIFNTIMEYLKNCNSIYLYSIINDLVFTGKVVVSNFPELDSFFCRSGIVHILNLDINYIPVVDCIVSSSSDIENLVTRSGLQIPVIYLNSLTKWCGVCGKTSSLNSIVSKYCSEECMNSVCSSQIKDLDTDDIIVRIKDNNASVKNEKFHNSVLKDAIRLEYAIKRESYKKEMRQPSMRKLSSVKSHEAKICKSVTKKGVKCKNKTIGNSDFCGIISHMSS